MKKILKYVYWHAEEAISVCFITVALILLTVQVLLRFTVKNTFGWIEEISRYMFIWVIYLSSAAAILHDTTIKVDIAEKIWPKKIRKHVVNLGKLATLVFSALVTYYSCIYIVGQIHNNALTASIQMSMWIPMLILPIGNGVITLRILIDFLENAVFHRKLVQSDGEIFEQNN